MNKEEALAICFANLKGSKDKDLLGTARALQYLKSFPEYKSNQKLGEAVGVSGETVSEFLTILRLPAEIQYLFEQRRLKSLEHGRRLWQLARTKPELLQETVEAISGMTAMDGRYLIDYIVRNPGVPVSEAKRTVMESKSVTKEEFHVIALLSDKEYRLLVNEARKREIPVDVLVTLIVRQWLESLHHGE